MKKLVLTIILVFPLALCAEEAPIPAEQNKTLVCAACHGAQGNSANPQWPNIAGQHAKYLLKQLKDIKEDKVRHVPTMLAVVANLTEKDMSDLSEYYAKMPLAQGTTPKKYVQRGEQLYRGGDYSKHITACIACHGPKGMGNGQAGFPVLSGQHAEYTVMQLQAFKEKKRSNDLNEIMRDISGRMSQEDMEAVSHYIEGLH
ncbi:MAG: c-type cytochrome [Legionella sp.]|nr:c-type cytochrome [Legionella sp.]